MPHMLMTRYQYNLPAALYEKLMALSDKKDKPINSLISEALVRTFPELRSLPAQTLASFLMNPPQKATP